MILKWQKAQTGFVIFFFFMEFIIYVHGITEAINSGLENVILFFGCEYTALYVR